MTWAETAAAGALGVRTLGSPPKEVVAHEGVLLTRRPLRDPGRKPPAAQEVRSLTNE